jgi:membrane protein implicated in regulation of membrane protease activity
VFSPLTIAIFMAALGLVGFICRAGLGLSPAGSILVAAPAGFLMTALVFWAFVKIFVSSQGSSLVSLEEATGLEGEVTVRISDGRIGSIAYVDKGSRVTLPARAEDSEEAFDRGDRVFISRVENNTAFVRRDRGSIWSS